MIVQRVGARIFGLCLHAILVRISAAGARGRAARRECRSGNAKSCLGKGPRNGDGFCIHNTITLAEPGKQASPDAEERQT
jgi:hypothetical protein